MSYADALSTKLLATSCCICGRPLRDAASVEYGIGPDCRRNYGFADGREENREEANRLIHEASLDGTRPDRILEIAGILLGFEMPRIADAIATRFARRASEGARERARAAGLGEPGSRSAAALRPRRPGAPSSPASPSAPPPPAVRIEEVSAPLFRGARPVPCLAVYTEYVPAFNEDFKATVPFKLRGWDGGRRCWLVVPSAKPQLLEALSRHFAGRDAVGPKGAFVVPSPEELLARAAERQEAPAAPAPAAREPRRRPVSAEALRAELRPAELAAARNDAAERCGTLAARGLAPYGYQAEGASWMAGQEDALLADDMGLGKTWQALIALPEGAAAVVVCPSAVKINWSREAAKLRPDLRCSVLRGRGSFRWPEPGELVVLNYDILPAVPEEGKEPTPTRPGYPAPPPGLEPVLIVDEAQNVKNPEAARSRSLAALRALCAARWYMTGTPVDNRVSEVWEILSNMGVAKAVFGSRGAYVRLVGARYVDVFIKGGRGATKKVIEWPLDASRVSPDFSRILRERIMLRRMKADVLPDLPRKVRTVLPVDVELPAEMKKAWKDYEDARSLRWGGNRPDDDWAAEWLRKNVINAAALYSRAREALAASLIPAAMELADGYEAAGRPAVFASAHRAPVDALAARPGWGRISGSESAEEKAETVRAFQAGELLGVAVTIRAGGVGVTLTRSEDMVFVDPDWNPKANEQMEDRICRIGATARSVSYVRLVANHPLTERVDALIHAKAETADAAVDGTGTSADAYEGHQDADREAEIEAEQARYEREMGY